MNSNAMGPGAPRYDQIGTGYGAVRVADPRIAAQIEQALGDAVTVLNVGAGTGSYESPRRKVVALEPSSEMIRQRPSDAPPAIVGRAEDLPFLDASVDACTAFLSVHHWADKERGLREMRRVARRTVVVLTYLPGAIAPSARWLSAEYFPFIAKADEVVFPRRETYIAALGSVHMVPVAIPADCCDGFLDAYWCRPEAYLDAHVRDGISGFRLMPSDELDAGISKLERDLHDGSWAARYGHLRSQETFDAGLRLVIAP